MKTLVLITLFFFISLNCQSAVVLLNFNENNSSVEAARVAAKHRDEVLIVFPFSDKHPESNLAKSIKSINKDTIENILKIISKYAREHDKPVSNITFSGHAGNGGFSGKSGSLRRIDFQKAIALYPKLTTSVKSLLLRGCYTATLGEVLIDSPWRKTFPNLSMIAGYEGKAWSSEKTASKTYVKEILQLEDSFTTASTVDEMIEYYQKLSHYKISATAVWVKPHEHPDEEVFITTNRLLKGNISINLGEISKECQHVEQRALAHNVKIHRFFAGNEPKYFRPYKNTQTPKNKIRKAYRFFNKYDHCQQYRFWSVFDRENNYLSPKHIMPILFMNKIIENFDRAYSLEGFAKLIDWANVMFATISKDFPYAQPLVFPDMKADNISDEMLKGNDASAELINASRGSFITFDLELASFLDNAQNIPSMDAPENIYKLKQLKAYHSAFNDLLINFSFIHLPHSWMTTDVFASKLLPFESEVSFN
jgi:hypothetical protein